MGLIVVAAAHQRSDVVGQLQGGEQVIGLADGGGQGLAVGPLQLMGLGVFRRGQRALAVADLDAGGAAQTELGGVIVDGLNAGQTAHLVKEVVARHGDGLADVHPPVGIAQRPHPAPGLGILVEGIHALVLNDGGGGDDAGFQRRHGGDHLESGAGGVGAVHGTVEHGQPLVGQQLVVVPAKGGGNERGIGGQRQHAAGAHLHHGGGAAPLVAVLVDHALDGGGQRVLRGGLQVQIQRQRHGTAGLGLLDVGLAGDLPLVVGGHQTGAVLTPQPVLKGLFHAAFAHQRVHGVALFPVFRPILGVDAGDAAQNVGGIGGVIGPDGILPRGHAGEIAVDDPGDQLRGHVQSEHIAAAARQLIADAGDQPGLGVGVFAVDVKQRPQVGQQLGGRGLALQLAAVQKLGEGLLVAGGQIQVRRRLGNGQRVHPDRVRLLTQADQLPDGVVELGVRLEGLLAEGQGIGQTVGHQHLAVAVGDDAAAGLHRLPCGVGGNGLGTVFAAVQNLGVIQRRQKQQQHQSQSSHQNIQAAAGGMGILHHGKGAPFKVR